MKIAIVDDEKIWLDKVGEKITQFFAPKSIEAQVENFTSGEDFLDDGGAYDIVFMDVEMPGRDGFSVLEEYRMDNPESIFIILTTHIEMSRQGYKVEAFRYIDKCEIEEIDEALNSAMLRLEKYQTVDIPVSAMQMQRIQCCNILYFEVFGHSVIMHLSNGMECKCTESLSELSKRLEEKGFLLTNRSYLVNMEHIKKVETNQIKLAGNVMIPLSRRKYPDVRKRFFDWKVRRANG